MKTILVTAVAILGLAGTSVAYTQPTVQVLGTVHSTSALGSGSVQDMTVNADGSIHAELRDGPVITTIDMQVSGASVMITKRDVWGMSTSMIDLARAEKFMDANPAVTALVERGFRTMDVIRNSHYAPQVKVSPMAAGPCASQAQAMINAGYTAIMVCSAGPSVGCVVAQRDYSNAVAAYNACMAALSKAPTG